MLFFTYIPPPPVSVGYPCAAHSSPTQEFEQHPAQEEDGLGEALRPRLRAGAASSAAAPPVGGAYCSPGEQSPEAARARSETRIWPFSGAAGRVVAGFVAPTAAATAPPPPSAVPTSASGPGPQEPLLFRPGEPPAAPGPGRAAVRQRPFRVAGPDPGPGPGLRGPCVQRPPVWTPAAEACAETCRTIYAALGGPAAISSFWGHGQTWPPSWPPLHLLLPPLASVLPALPPLRLPPLQALTHPATSSHR